MRQSGGGPSSVQWKMECRGEKPEVGLDAVEGGGALDAFYRPGRQAEGRVVVKPWPSMASMANGFKALRGGEGVTGSTHSRGGGIGGAQQLESHRHGTRGGRPMARTDDGGDSILAEGRRTGEGTGGPTWPEWPSIAGRFQRKSTHATRRMRAKT
jgi:hypothetical protein